MLIGIFITYMGIQFVQKVDLRNKSYINNLWSKMKVEQLQKIKIKIKIEFFPIEIFLSSFTSF